MTLREITVTLAHLRDEGSRIPPLGRRGNEAIRNIYRSLPPNTGDDNLLVAAEKWLEQAIGELPKPELVKQDAPAAIEQAPEPATAETESEKETRAKSNPRRK